MRGRIVLVSRGDFQSYNIVCRGKNEVGVEKYSLEIGRSELIHSSPNHIPLVSWSTVVLSFHLPLLLPPPIFWVRGTFKGYPNIFGSLYLFKNSNEIICNLES